MTSNQHQRIPPRRSPHAAVAPPRPPNPAAASVPHPDTIMVVGSTRGAIAMAPQPKQDQPVLSRRRGLSATAHRLCARCAALARVVVNGAASGGLGRDVGASRDNRAAARRRSDAQRSPCQLSCAGGTVATPSRRRLDKTPPFRRVRRPGAPPRSSHGLGTRRRR